MDPEAAAIAAGVWRVANWTAPAATHVAARRADSIAVLRTLGEGDVLATQGRLVLVEDLAAPGRFRSWCRIQSIRRDTDLEEEAYIAYLTAHTSGGASTRRFSEDSPSAWPSLWGQSLGVRMMQEAGRAVATGLGAAEVKEAADVLRQATGGAAVRDAATALRSWMPPGLAPAAPASLPTALLSAARHESSRASASSDD